MVRYIAQKEVREALRDGRFRLAFATVFALLVVAGLVGWHAWQREAAVRREAQAEDRRIWQTQGPVNPHSAAHFGRYISKPASPVAFVDRGLDPYLGEAARLEAHTQTPNRHRPIDDAPALARFGELTAATVLQLLVPLLIVLLTYGAFAEERERGTLRHVLSLGVSPRALAAGKALGLGASLLVLLVPVALLGAGVLLLGPDGRLSLPRLLLLSLAYLAYFTAFAALGVAISARARSARAALATLLAFWVVNGLLMPRLAADAASRVYPLPSTEAFFDRLTTDMRKGLDGHDPTDARVEALKQRVLAQYQVTRVEDLPINFDGLALQESEEHGNPVLDHHYGHLWMQYARQERVQQALSVVGAPLLALRSVSMALAGTDLAAHRHFTEQAEQYRRRFVRELNLHMAEHSRHGDWDWKADASLYATMADFSYTPPSLRAVGLQAWPAAALLSLWMLGACGVAALAVRRLPVEE